MLFFLILTIKSYAQINPKPGYIVTLANDTIQGYIDYRSALQNASHCFFQANGENNYKEYLPKDIKAYRFTDNGKYYISFKFVNEKGENHRFLEFLVKGKINLYYLPGANENHYCFENESGELTWVEVPERTNEVTDASERRKERNSSLRPLFKIFENSTSIKEKLVKEKLSKNNLIKLTKEYHYEKSNNAKEECIQFEYSTNKEQTVTIEWYINTGISLNSTTVDEWEKWKVGSMKNNSPYIKAGLDIYLPRLSDCFYIQTALSLTYLKGEGERKQGYALEEYKYVKLETCTVDTQLGVAYRLSKKRLTPILQAGALCSMFLNSKTNDKDITPFGSSFINKYKLHSGYYAGITLVYELREGSILLNGIFKSRSSASWSSIEIGAGYKF